MENNIQKQVTCEIKDRKKKDKMENNKQKKLALYITHILIWLLAIVFAVFVFIKTYEPNVIQETFGTGHDVRTEVLMAGDSVSQTFTSSYDKLKEISVALSYQDTLTESATALIEIYRNDLLIVEQTLTIQAIPNQTLIPLKTNGTDSLNDEFTVVITNTSDVTLENAKFAVMKSIMKADNAEIYKQNNITQTGNILVRTTYETLGNLYKSFSYVICVFFGAIVLSSLLHRCNRYQKGN